MAHDRATKIFEWKSDATRYRLIARAKYTRGYEDVYILEKASEDALGETRWDSLKEWDTDAVTRGGECAPVVLIAGIKAALQGVKP